MQVMSVDVNWGGDEDENKKSDCKTSGGLTVEGIAEGNAAFLKLKLILEKDLRTNKLHVTVDVIIEGSEDKNQRSLTM